MPWTKKPLGGGRLEIPNELFDLILHHMSLKDLSVLMRCSQTLHNYIEPMLYKPKLQRDLAMHWACSTGVNNTIKRCVQYGSDISVVDIPSDFTRFESDMIPCRTLANLLIASRSFESNVKFRRAVTTLHIATLGGHIDTFKLLLELGAQISGPETQDILPEVAATFPGSLCRRYRQEMFFLFLGSSASQIIKPDPLSGDWDADTMLTAMTMRGEGNQSMTRALLDRGATPHRVSPHSEDRGFAPSFLVRFVRNLCPLSAAVYSNSIPVLDTLLEHGGDINGEPVGISPDSPTSESDRLLGIPIFVAVEIMAKTGCTRMLDHCLERGAKINHCVHFEDSESTEEMGHPMRMVRDHGRHLTPLAYYVFQLSWSRWWHYAPSAIPKVFASEAKRSRQPDICGNLMLLLEKGAAFQGPGRGCPGSAQSPLLLLPCLLESVRCHWQYDSLVFRQYNSHDSGMIWENRHFLETVRRLARMPQAWGASMDGLLTVLLVINKWQCEDMRSVERGYQWRIQGQVHGFVKELLHAAAQHNRTLFNPTAVLCNLIEAVSYSWVDKPEVHPYLLPDESALSWPIQHFLVETLQDLGADVDAPLAVFQLRQDSYEAHKKGLVHDDAAPYNQHWAFIASLKGSLSEYDFERWLEFPWFQISILVQCEANLKLQEVRGGTLLRCIPEFLEMCHDRFGSAPDQKRNYDNLLDCLTSIEWIFSRDVDEAAPGTKQSPETRAMWCSFPQVRTQSV